MDRLPFEIKLAIANIRLAVSVTKADLVSCLGSSEASTDRLNRISLWRVLLPRRTCLKLYYTSPNSAAGGRARHSQDGAEYSRFNGRLAKSCATGAIYSLKGQPLGEGYHESLYYFCRRLR